MCSKCVLKRLEEYGVDVDEIFFLTKPAVILISKMYDIMGDYDKYGVTEDQGHMSVETEAVDTEPGTFLHAMKDEWNACTPAERTMAFGAITHGMFILPLVKALLGQHPLKERQLN